jgi:hypothetical protein
VREAGRTAAIVEAIEDSDDADVVVELIQARSGRRPSRAEATRLLGGLPLPRRPWPRANRWSSAWRTSTGRADVPRP